MHKYLVRKYIAKNLAPNEKLIGFFYARTPFPILLMFLTGPLAILFMKTYYLAITDKGIHFFLLNTFGNWKSSKIVEFSAINDFKHSNGYLTTELEFVFADHSIEKFRASKRGVDSLAKILPAHLDFISLSISKNTDRTDKISGDALKSAPSEVLKKDSRKKEITNFTSILSYLSLLFLFTSIIPESLFSPHSFVTMVGKPTSPYIPLFAFPFMNEFRSVSVIFINIVLLGSHLIRGKRTIYDYILPLFVIIIFIGNQAIYSMAETSTRVTDNSNKNLSKYSFCLFSKEIKTKLANSNSYSRNETFPDEVMLKFLDYMKSLEIFVDFSEKKSKISILAEKNKETFDISSDKNNFLILPDNNLNLKFKFVTFSRYIEQPKHANFMGFTVYFNDKEVFYQQMLKYKSCNKNNGEFPRSIRVVNYYDENHWLKFLETYLGYENIQSRRLSVPNSFP